MPRIAQIEINVNVQMKIQIENSKDGQSEVNPILFDPGWGAECIDPVTGKKAKLYDHVPRSMKFSGGIQIWILIPRYSLEGGGLFRVLPANLCVYKHYVVEEIQDALDEAIGEMTESEKTSSEGKLQQQLDGSEDASVRPCDRTKWLWLLWFFRNLLQIESVLRMIHFVNATMTGAGESTFLKILNRTDYLMELRLKEQDDWLKVVIQTAWNSGQPLIPLRDMETMQEVWTAIAVHPIPE
jgi:hypothetical protein